MSLLLSNRIQAIPHHDVDSINGNIATLKNGKAWSYFFTENELVFSETQGNQNGAEVWQQQLTVTVVLSTEEFEAIKRRSLIIMLFDTSGAAYIWGSVNNPVQFTAQTYPDRYSLTFTRTAKSPIF